MIKINKQADDFGLSINASNTILGLINEGYLDRISFMPNMSCFEEISKEAETIKNKGIFVKTHLNFVEGKCVSSPSLIPDLVNQDGSFKTNWKKIFFYNYNIFKRKDIKKQLKIEIQAQLERVNSLFNESSINIDSHQHAHMIPLLFEAIQEVIKEQNYQVNHIRVVKEPLWPYLKHLSLYKTYKPINFIKNMILNWYSIKVDRTCRNQGMEPMYVWGLVMSGHMDEERIEVLMPDMVKTANKKGRALELIFHPGALSQEEADGEFKDFSDLDFYISPNRKVEEETIRNLKVPQ